MSHTERYNTHVGRVIDGLASYASFFFINGHDVHDSLPLHLVNGVFLEGKVCRGPIRWRGMRYDVTRDAAMCWPYRDDWGVVPILSTFLPLKAASRYKKSAISSWACLQRIAKQLSFNASRLCPKCGGRVWTQAS